jgi:glucoselysine-6-phosphate deglycase
MERELLIAQMIREVSTQGRKNIKNARELTRSLTDVYLKNNYQDITIVACGSSYNGSVCGRTFMEKVLKRKVRVLSPENFEFYDNLIYDDEMLCVVSFSGASTNSISALQKINAMGRRSIGITGYPESDFKYIADLTIEYGLNGEDEPYETKGVTLLALYFMLFALEAALRRGTITEAEYDSYHQEMLRCMDGHDQVMNSTTAFVKKHRIPLIGMQSVTFVGTGAGYALSLEAKLKFGELLKINTDAHELEEYIHGPSIKLQPGQVVFYLDSSEKTRERTVQIYEASKVITPFAFLLTPDQSITGDNVFHLPIKADDTLLPLYALVFYQQAVHDLTYMRHCFAETELYRTFSSMVPIKSDKYNKSYFEKLKTTF